MIKTLENGSTLITLGEGTVYAGLVQVENVELPVGICFTNQKGQNPNPAESIIFQITDEKGVASYLMALIRLLEAWDAGNESSAIRQTLNELKADLEKLLPEEKKPNVDRSTDK